MMSFTGSRSGAFVEVCTRSTFQQFDVVERIEGGIADFVDEHSDAFGAITATTDTTKRRHTGVVPTIHHSFFGEKEKVALRHQRVIEVQFVELKLTWAIVCKVFATHLFIPIDKQVVERTVRYKLKRADGMCNPF